MQYVSSDYLPSLAGSHQQAATVQAWRGGRLVAASLPVVSGSVALQAGQSISGTLKLQVADPDGLFVPAGDGALSPYGSELVVRAGMVRRSVTEMFLLGHFVITAAESQEGFKAYERPDEPGVQYQVARGQSTDVDAADRALSVQESRFVSRTQPTQPTVLREIRKLLIGIIPWEAPQGVTDRTIPGSVTYEDDRLDAIEKLAALLDMQPLMKRSGAMTLVPMTRTAASVWRIPTGVGGVRVSMQRKLARQDIHNAVVARGSGKDDRPLQAVAYDRSAFLAYGGPFGRVPSFYESPLLKTQEQVQKAADTRLARERANRLQTISVTCVANHALDLYDTVSLSAPRGDLTGQVMGIAWSLGPGADGSMSLDVAVDPFLLADLSR